MKQPENPDAPRRQRNSPVEMDPETFRELGHDLVDRIAGFMATMPRGPVTTGERPSQIRSLLGGGGLPREGAEAGALLQEAARLLFDHSLFNGHPRFFGYITSPPTPIGALGDLLASSVNPNVGGWILSPVATEMELQTVRWIAEMVGYPTDCGGILVSGGNMANFVGFLAARHARAGWPLRSGGLRAEGSRALRVYASTETHTWIYKAADLFGLGTEAIRWIPVTPARQIDTSELRRQIEADRAAGDQPFLVVGTGGSVSTGVVDPLAELAALCREHDLWFHVDGAYGAFAAALPEQRDTFIGLEQADSVALDPHKWLYAPLEAGCALIRDPQLMWETFSYHPPYYKLDGVGGEPATSLFDFGLQNSRSFRALKVWLALRQAGRDGYERMIREDIALMRRLFELARDHAELEAVTHYLSITTFRYVPTDLASGDPGAETYLNELNRELLTRLQEGGEAFVSNAVIDERYLLRACVVNFRTSIEDVEALPRIVCRIGREVDRRLRKG